MHLTLICGADPAKAKGGPQVRLQAGRYRFHLDNVTTTEMLLEMGSRTEVVKHGSEFILTEPEISCINFSKRGKERYVTVNVERVA